jgi:hypothetical protein
MVRWHTQRRDECFIGHMELRSLPADRYETYIALRSRFEYVLRSIVRDGCKKGLFRVADDRIATIAVLQTLASICQWYRPDGRLSVKRLTRIYTQMILDQLRADRQNVTRVA